MARTYTFSQPDEPIELYRPTWVEIDLDAYVRNVDALARLLPQGSKLIAVLKANGYGHGSVELARCCEGRFAMIAVALLEEAIEFRRAGIATPILLLGPLTTNQVPVAIEQDIAMGITGPESLDALVGAHASLKGARARVHLKLDSGMGRMGFMPGDLAALPEILRANPWIEVEGIYTHFANASDPADPYTEVQMQSYARMLAELRAAGITAPLHHTSNSAATLRGLVSHGDFVRVGLTLLGGEPLDAGSTRLEPILTWRTSIVRLKEIPAGHPVGYGSTFKASRPSRIATLPVGYADGYNRLLSNRGEVLLHGLRAPVVGRVSMDLVTIDVTGIELAATGDPVVLLGRQGNDEISAEEIAKETGTISYEVFTSISERVPRLYRTGDDILVKSKVHPTIERRTSAREESGGEE